MSDLDQMEARLQKGFHLSFPPMPPSAFEDGLNDLLHTADDLLFILKETGQILGCKARKGAILASCPFAPGSFISDILPVTVKRKYNRALDDFQKLRRFTMFESMLLLPPSVLNWYEFRLIPALQNQTLLFIWDVSKYRGFSRTVSNLSFSIEKMLEGWSRSLYLRDFETEDHTGRVTGMALRLAKRLGLPEEELVNIRRGAQVHDIGKISIPDSILLKTGGLTSEEWDLMRQHPLIAVELLESIPGIEQALVIPRSHHEKWNGSGYPDQLIGEEIPLAARIFAFADVYDALTSDRPYRRAWSKEFALDHIRREAGIHFDPHLAPDFLHMVQDQ